MQSLNSGASAQEHSKDWVSTDWDVRCQNPDGPGPCEGQETAVAVFQGYLKSSSEWYESLGFHAPKVVKPSGKYQALIVPSEDAYALDGDPYAGLYDPNNYRIYLNEDNFFAMGEPGQTLEEAYFLIEQSYIFTSVHEVFHAIQETYSDFVCGEGRGWICEGMADAALRAYADKFESELNIAMETRPYHEPLHQPSEETWRYGTWQFWLDVGRHLNSTDGITYFRDVMQKDLTLYNGLMGVDHALKDLMADGDADPLWAEGGLYDLLPWFLAEHDPDSIFLQPLRRSFQLEAGQTSVEERITNIVVQPVAGRTVELTINKPADTAVGVSVSFGEPDEDLHLIVDNVRYDKATGEDRNVYFTVSRKEQQLKLDVVIANVAKVAQMTRESNVDLVVELITEHASMGRSNSAANPSPADLSAIAAAIDAPLEIELARFRATLMQDRHKRSGDTFVGIGEAAGVERPCLLQLSGEAPRRAGSPFADALLLMMRTTGPLTASQTYQIRSSEETRGLSDLTADVAVVSALVTEGDGQQYNYDVEHGELIIDSVAGQMLRGRLTGEGTYREYSPQTLKYEVRKVQNLAAKFAIWVQAPLGRYSDRPYACLASARP